MNETARIPSRDGIWKESFGDGSVMYTGLRSPGNVVVVIARAPSFVRLGSLYLAIYPTRCASARLAQGFSANYI